MKVLIIIPAYNEADSIVKVVNDIKSNCINCDYVIINDCSTDNTKEIVEDNNFNCINLPVNLGLSGAVQTGYKYALKYNYDCAIQFDGDGQHQATYIEILKAKIVEGYDVVIGSRFLDNKKPISARMIGSRFITILINIFCGQKINDPTSGMRMLSRNALQECAYSHNRRPEPDTLVYLIRNKYKVCEVQVEMIERFAGISIYSGITSSLKYMVKMTLSIIFLAK